MPAPSASTRTPSYAEGVAAPPRPPVQGEEYVDAVVIGAGYAGVSAALEFARAGLQTLIIEKENVAAGASGRNGGILLLSEGTHLGDADESSAVDEALGTAAEDLVGLIEKLGIDAGLSRGTIRLAVTARQARELRESAGAGADRAQSARRFLDPAALKEFLRSDRYSGGLLETENIVLNPFSVLEGIAQHTESLGVRIACGEPVTSLNYSGREALISTPSARIRTSRLVVAAGTGIGQVVPALRRALLTAYSQIAVTEPLPAAILDAVLPASEATSEIIATSRYYRRLPDNRLLFGISTILDPLTTEQLEGRIRSELRDTFPALGDVPFASAWQGEIASTPEETPLMERLGPAAIATSSNGVLASWHAGRVAARATSPEFAAYDDLRDNPHRSWPPLGLPLPLVQLGSRILFSLKNRH